MQGKLEKALENLFKPQINSLKLGKITLGCYTIPLKKASPDAYSSISINYNSTYILYILHYV
jgi:hypothetical protein